MEAIEWINDPKTIEKSRRSYAHFDWRTDIAKMADYIVDPQNISRHSFYPFIHYTMRMRKYSRNKGKDVKRRDIYYASHTDRCIFQYYSFIMNEEYNEYVRKFGIDNVAVAYRTNLKENNISLSKKAFDFIKAIGNSYVIIGDFTDFFDCLDHKYLKSMMQEVLGVDKLPDDYYAVYKNVTRFSYVELDKLLEMNGLRNTKKDIKKLNKKSVVLRKKDFNDNKSIIQKNTDGKGVPQGSPISAVLANVYMIDCDKRINEYIYRQGGMYMRYSDDFIIVFPLNDRYRDSITKVLSIIGEVPNLVLKPSKTQLFCIKNKEIKNIGRQFDPNIDNSKKVISFLGFTFDGVHIHLRAKTIGKYYYRMIRKAKSISYGGGMGWDKLYIKYSDKGDNRNNDNFFTYVNRAEKIYGDNELIKYDLRNHMAKIRKTIKKCTIEKHSTKIRENGR